MTATPTPVEFVMPLNNEQKMLACLERIEALLIARTPLTVETPAKAVQVIAPKSRR